MTHPPLIHVERPRPGSAVAVFVGEHDLSTRDSARALLESLIDENELLVLDLSDTAFVDSTTIHVFFDMHFTALSRGRRMRLQLGTAPIVRAALELTGFLDRVECYSSRQEALA